MKVTVMKPVEVEAAAISIFVPVRYGDEDMPFDAPGRAGDVWRAIVDIDTGKIRDWPGGALDMDMKVCDCGEYILLDRDGHNVAEILNDYVPECVPNGYGDYLTLSITEDGTVTNWNEHCDAEAVRVSFFPTDDDE